MPMRGAGLFVIVAAAFISASNGKSVNSGRCTEFPCLIFEDEFDKLDFKTWEHEITAGGGGNWEFQYYTNNRSNSYVKDGVLYMKPTLAEDKWGKDWVYTGNLNLWGSQVADECTGNQWWGCERQAFGSTLVNVIQSARLRTANSFTFRYGRFELEAKLPKGDWIWPAIWLLPRYQKYGPWPSSGEIDLMEARCNADLYDAQGNQIGSSTIGSTLHYGPYWPENGYAYATNSFTKTNGRSFSDDFHIFAVEWDETGIRFYVDDKLFQEVDTADGYWKRGKFEGRLPEDRNHWQYSPNPDAPFDQDFYIILNVAVGGTGGYFDDSFRHPSYPKPWTDKSDTAMRQFWDAKSLWYPTWPQDKNEDDRAMQIRWLRVWKMKQDCFLDGTCK